MGWHGGDVCMRRMMIGCLNGIRIAAYDRFDRANGALGTAEVGGAWSSVSGTCAIASNKAKGTTSGASNIAALECSVTEQDVSASVVWYTGETASLLCRVSDANNYMRVRVDGTTLQVFRVVSGSSTSIATYSYTWTSGAAHKLSIKCAANTFYVLIDDALVITVTDDNATKTYTKAGFVAFKTGAVPESTFDNFMVMA